MGKRRTRITYAPRSRRRSSASVRNQSISSNAQEDQSISSNAQENHENSVRSKPRRRSRNRIVYDPKARRKSSASKKTQSTSTSLSSANVQEIKETSRRNKRSINDTASASLQQQPKRKKGSSSSTEEKSSHRRSKSKKNEDGSEVTDKQSTAAKREVYRRRKQVKEADTATKHIRDMTVTKKTYARWRPLSSSTKTYTKQVLEGTILSVLNTVGAESKKKDLQVHLRQLSERIVTRLDSLKGPPHKGDYSKMQAESQELENAVISCNGQIEALEKELEEQTRLLEEDQEMLTSYGGQERQPQQQKKLHPLLQEEPVNTLNLPSLSDEVYKMPLVPASLESNGRQFADSLAKMSDQAEQVGFTNWLEAVSKTTTYASLSE